MQTCHRDKYNFETSDLQVLIVATVTACFVQLCDAGCPVLFITTQASEASEEIF